MKKYADYRKTSSPFLKTVPSHWIDVKLRHCYTIKSISNTSNEPLLSVFLNRGVVSYTDTDMKQVHKPSEDMKAYQLVLPGDFVLNNQQAWRGSVGVSSHRGIVSPAYIVMAPITENNPRFMNYMLRETACISQFVLASKGVGSIQRILSPIKLKSSIVVLPPRDEQDQIVRYLDWQVSKINRLIAAKQKQIELTREYALAKIEDVFNTTIGTDSDNIPIGRHIRKIESGTSVNSIIGTADKETPGVLSTSCVYGNHFDASQNKRVEPADYERVSCPVRKNTVIVSRMNTPALVGACGFSDKDIDNVFLPDRLWQVYFDDTLMPEFVWRYLSRPRAQAWFATIATGSSNTMKNITKPQFKAVLIPNVPSDMQRRIIKSISKITDERDTACQLYEQTISTLQALRTRLISDVVTGQIDVRGIEVPNYEHYDEAPENATEESSDSDYDTEE